MKKITKNIVTLIITLGVFSSPFFAHAATWVGPTATPPGNNVSAPVNVGGTYQIKVGDLGVISFFANYIKSIGTISANRYCFNNGPLGGRDTNCITSWPAGGTGGGIESIVAGTNVTVDNTDPLNPIVSSTATGGTSGVIVRKDGVPVVAPATTLNFLGSNITTTPSGSSVSIAVTPATPTAIRKDGIQVSAAPLAVNFVGDNITATNNGGIVSVGVNKFTVKQDDNTVGSNFTGINFVGGSDWVVTNGGGGIARIENVANPVTQLALPSASPADKILRSDGTNWVQSPLVKTTVSSFQVNRPIADNANENIFNAAKMVSFLGNPVPLIGLFVTKEGDTYVNGAKFRHYGVAGTTAVPTNSFGTDDLFQAGTGTTNQKGIAIRADGGVRVRGELSALNNAVVPLSSGLFLGANDIFHVVGELNGAKKGFGLAVDGTTRVEGVLAINGGQALIGDMNHVGDTNHTGNYTMSGLGATMILGNSTENAQLDIVGNSSQDGNQSQTGNYSLDGNFNQTGNYSLSGNMVQTGNINTNGRWAVSDTISSPILAVGLTGGGVPTTPPVIPYTFLSKVSGAHNGSLGLNRAGSTIVNGDLQVYGPSTISGNLSVGGWIETETLANTDGDLHVCASTSGRLKICTVPTPQVDITDISSVDNTIVGSDPSYAFSAGHYTSSTTTIPNPSKSATVSYTIGNFTSNMSCERFIDSGSASGWIGTFTPTQAVNNVNVTITAHGTTSFRVKCKNQTGQSSQDIATVRGAGSWTWTRGTGVMTVNFPTNAMLSVELWGAGGGGGSYAYINNLNTCGGGGGAGQYQSHPNIGYGGQYQVSLYGGGGALGINGNGSDGGSATINKIGNGNQTYFANGGSGGKKGTPIYLNGMYGASGGLPGSNYGISTNPGQGTASSGQCTPGAGKVPSYALNGNDNSGGVGGSLVPGMNLFGKGQNGSIRVTW